MDENKLPSSLPQWQDFIQRVNNSFNDFEQESYLLERSMVISSREMLELYEQLDTAQTIAHIGYWFYNAKDNKIIWSKETYRIVGLDTSSPPLLDEFILMVHPDDRNNLLHLINQAIEKGIDYETEFRIVNARKKKTIWIYSKAHPYKDKKSSATDSYLLSGIIMDITKTKKSQTEVEKLNQKLISISRKAGMSEVATSVLHNIGNVLNSLNISAYFIQDLINDSKIENIKKIGKLIQDNISTPDYLLSNPKGKFIPDYLNKLGDILLSEHTQINEEIKNLLQHTQHIKDIVIMQKEISGKYEIYEDVNLLEIAKLAIKIAKAKPIKYDFEIITNYKYQGSIKTEKSKLLQILVNLITNAIDAVKDVPESKIITITIKKFKNTIRISVKDNGIGILKENLTKIFVMGFTTKNEGHGFGLHSSALIAKELGGSLIAKSDGLGKGALFTLNLPTTRELK